MKHGFPACLNGPAHVPRPSKAALTRLASRHLPTELISPYGVTWHLVQTLLPVLCHIIVYSVARALDFLIRISWGPQRCIRPWAQRWVSLAMTSFSDDVTEAQTRLAGGCVTSSRNAGPQTQRLTSAPVAQARWPGIPFQ